jgi:hypothetical protein
MLTRQQYDEIQYRLGYARSHQHTPQLFIDYYLNDVEMLLKQVVEADIAYVDRVIHASVAPV